MAKIAIDARELRTTTGRYVERLLHYLQTTDATNEYVIMLKPQDFDGWTPTNSRFTKVVNPHKEFTFAEQNGFKSLLDSLHVDLVHFPMVQQPVRYKGRVVTTMNDLTTVRFGNPSKDKAVYWAKRQVYKWVNKRVAQKSNALITYTEFVKQDVAQYTGVNPDKITVTPLAADKITDAPEPVTALSDKQFIMYIGRPMPHKNLERLVEAFGFLQQANPALVLALAGKKDANYERIEAYAQSKGITNVLFTGFVSEGQLRWMYENCAVYAFPSLSEGFGLPGLEAMMHGAPVASSNATCLPEVNGDAAHYFDPLDVADIARAIQDILVDPDLAKELRTKGYERVKLYSWQRMAEQTLAVYHSVLSR